MRFLFSVILFILLDIDAYSQRYGFEHNFVVLRGNYLNTYYDEFKSMGDTLDGRRHGTWISKSVDSIVYLKREYDHGMPAGEWIINFPDGTPRIKFHFNEHNALVKWERYHQSQKMAELICPYGLTRGEMMFITRQEERIFELQLKDFKSFGFKYGKEPLYVKIREDYSGYAYLKKSTNPHSLLEKFGENLIGSGFSCKYCLWDKNGNLTKMLIVKDGKPIREVSNFYVNNRLKRRYIYEHGKLVREITLNRKGEFKKQKIYR